MKKVEVFKVTPSYKDGSSPGSHRGDVKLSADVVYATLGDVILSARSVTVEYEDYTVRYQGNIEEEEDDV